MTLNFEGLYNECVTGHKFIHFALIAMLCFGQLVASAHVAGHLLPNPHQFGGIEHDHSTHAHNHQSAFAHRCALNLANQFGAGCEQPKNDNNHSGEAKDCTLYHAFSNLSCAHSTTQLLSNAPLNHDVARRTVDTHTAQTATDRLRIRAPPSFT